MRGVKLAHMTASGVEFRVGSGVDPGRYGDTSRSCIVPSAPCFGIP